VRSHQRDLRPRSLQWQGSAIPGNTTPSTRPSRPLRAGTD
jgi:hypothetical protein